MEKIGDASVNRKVAGRQYDGYTTAIKRGRGGVTAFTERRVTGV